MNLVKKYWWIILVLLIIWLIIKLQDTNDTKIENIGLRNSLNRQEKLVSELEDSLQVLNKEKVRLNKNLDSLISVVPQIKIKYEKAKSNALLLSPDAKIELLTRHIYHLPK